MLQQTSPLSQLIKALADGSTTPTQVAAATVLAANGNALHNTYLHFSEQDLAAQVDAYRRNLASTTALPLYSIPISLKDCFDLAGTVTTCGAKYYAEHTPIATEDSALAAQLRASGALITGKTHLHALAYGITGQNAFYGDCLQPRDAALLTGGSSSGAAASVQEGSALAAIGTDTGGSVRVPSALCGLAGYRASLRLAYDPGPWPASADGLWAGAAHLAAAFDTPGILLRDPRDLAPLAHVLFGVPFEPAPQAPRIGVVSQKFLTDCDSAPLACLEVWRPTLSSAGASVSEFYPESWNEAQEIFAGVQAHEAAELHRGHFEEFEPAIAQRLQWGESLDTAAVNGLRERHEAFRAELLTLFDHLDFLMLPCAPVSRLPVDEDQVSIRQRLLRYTTPFSLAGLPVLALPGEILGAPLGTGVQIAAPPGKDAELLAYAAALGELVAAREEH